MNAIAPAVAVDVARTGKDYLVAGLRYSTDIPLLGQAFQVKAVAEPDGAMTYQVAFSVYLVGGLTSQQSQELLAQCAWLAAAPPEPAMQVFVPALNWQADSTQMRERRSASTHCGTSRVYHHMRS